MACGGSGPRQNPFEPSKTPTAETTPNPYVPDEEPAPLGPPGRITTQVQATCRLSTVDAQIDAVYRAVLTGPNGNLRRVRLLVNNKLADDSGEIFTNNYERTVTLHVSSGANYTLTVSAYAINATGPQLINIVRCPASPGPGA